MPRVGSVSVWRRQQFLRCQYLPVSIRVCHVDLMTNATCLKRRINDTCLLSTDCGDAVINSTCGSNETCVCISGFYSNADGTTCIERKIGDQCSTNTDCTSAIENSGCDGVSSVCQCLSGFMVTANSTQCVLRQISDPCLVNLDCSDAVNRSTCVNETCQCTVGYQSLQNGRQCVLREYCISIIITRRKLQDFHLFVQRFHRSECFPVSMPGRLSESDGLFTTLQSYDVLLNHFPIPQTTGCAKFFD